MIDFRQASNPLKRLSARTAVQRDFAIPRKTLSTTGASDNALPLIQKRNASSPRDEPNPADPVKTIVRLREAIENRTLFCRRDLDVSGMKFRLEFQAILSDNKFSCHESGISWCSKSGPHDFKMVFVNAAMATRALNLDGFTLRDRTSINLRRPPEYNGPETHTKTWNEFAATRPQSDINNIQKERSEREVYLNHVPSNTNPEFLKHFLGDAIERASLNICEGNPIIWCTVKRKRGFVTFRTSEEAAAATFSLNKIQFCGARLSFERDRNIVGRCQDLHHDRSEIPFAKDAHKAPCPLRLERGNFKLQGSQLPVSVLPPTSGNGSCCSLLPQDLPSNRERISADMADENVSTPPRPKKRVRFNLKEDDEEGCGKFDGKAKHQACAKDGENSASPITVTQDCILPRPQKRLRFNLKEDDEEGCGTSDGKAKHQTCTKVGEKSASLTIATQDCTPPRPKKTVRFNVNEDDEEGCGTSDGKAKHQTCAKVEDKSASLTIATQDCTPPRPQKRLRFNLKEDDEEGCGKSDGKAKYQACAKVGEKSAAPTDCHTKVDEQHTDFVLSVLNQANQDRENLKWQLEGAIVGEALLQQQLSEMTKRLAESDASRACLKKSALDEKRELLAAQQQLFVMHKVWSRTTKELEDTRQQLQDATEQNRMQAASIHFDKPLLAPSIKQEVSCVKCEGGEGQVRASLSDEEEFWDV
jgi:ubiquitin